MTESIITMVGLVAAVVGVSTVFTRWLRADIRALDQRLTDDNRELRADVKRILERLPAP